MTEGTRDQVIAGEALWSVEAGNSLAVLQSLPDACADAIITDPPYSSGGAFRGDRTGTTTEKYVLTGTKIQRPDFAGDNRDQRSFEYWCVLWMAEALRVAKPGAVFCCFTDWRQLPTTTDAIQGGGWVWRGIVPWDKLHCRPAMGRFAAQCEYVVWSTAGPRDLNEEIGILPGIVRGYPKPSEKHHITGKPVEVLQELVKIAPVGGVILDPFCGAASTGVAALLEGRRFLGCELVEDYVQVSRERLRAVDTNSTIQARAAGQGALFG